MHSLWCTWQRRLYYQIPAVACVHIPGNTQHAHCSSTRMAHTRNTPHLRHTAAEPDAVAYKPTLALP